MRLIRRALSDKLINERRKPHRIRGLQLHSELNSPPTRERLLEFLSLQKLIPQSTVKCLDISVLPGTRRGHRDRHRTDTCSQLVNAPQMNSDPLSLRIRVGPPRPMTRATILRTSAPVSESAACKTRHSRVYSSTNVSHLSGPPLGRAVVNEVARPNIVLEPSRLPDATVRTGTRFRAEFSGFSQPYGPLQPQLAPEPVHALRCSLSSPGGPTWRALDGIRTVDVGVPAA